MENSKLNYIVSEGVYTPVGNLSNVVQQLPPAVYVIRDFPMQGTKLIKRDSVDTSSPKNIYGKIPSYLEKTFSAFERRRLNTGVLLSGERGMGKTLSSAWRSRGLSTWGSPWSASTPTPRYPAQ